MLGTFPFELWFKSYRWFTEESLEFLEIAKSPFSSTTPLLCSHRRPPTAPTPAPWKGFPAAVFRRAGPHASRRSSSPSCCLALEPPRPCHAPRRVQKHPCRRHLAVAVERPLHSPPLFSLARIRTRELSLIFSPRPLALSLPRHPGTPPPLHRTPASLKPAVEPRLHSRSAQIDHANSFASLSRSSQATSRRLSSPRTPSRRAPP